MRKNQVALDLLFLIPVGIFFIFSKLGQGSLASWDEAIYAEVSKEMFRSGHWLRLTLDGAPWADKPPLSMWATAFFYQLFGVCEFSARFFSALCGLGLVLTTYFLGKRLFDRQIGFVGSLVLLSSIHFLRVTRFGTMDMPLAFLMALSLYFFWLGLEKNFYFLLSGVFFGFAFMTKSFASLPVIAIIGLYLITSKELCQLKRPLFWAGLTMAFLIIFPWIFYSLFMQPGVFMSSWIHENLFQRTAEAMDGHRGDGFFYLRVLFNKFRPWSIFAIGSVPFFIAKSLREKKGATLFLSVWMLVTFLVPTIVKTKLAWYVFPIYPALSLCVGYFFAKILKNRLWTVGVFLAVLAFQVEHVHVWTQDFSPGIQAAAAKKILIPEGQVVYLYNYHETPAVSFYLSRRAAYLDDPTIFSSIAKTQYPFFCFIQNKELGAVAPLLPGLGVSVQGEFKDLTLLTKP